MTAPIDPQVQTDSRRIAAETPPADAQRSGRGSVGSVDSDDAGQGALSAAVSVDVRGAVGAENQAAAASAAEDVDAAARLVSTLSAQLAADPSSARGVHAGVNGQTALSLLT